MSYEFRKATAADQPFLWQMLYYAAHMDESAETPESARLNPDLAPYVEGFGRLGDLGVIALDPANRTAAGAAWIREMPASWPLYRFIAPGTPELAIAVVPTHIGQGAGSAMLLRLLGDAALIYPAVALSVRGNNPARALYERSGFVTVATTMNRLGGESYVMRATLTPARWLKNRPPGTA
jgi:ribosomal protein S18 acetylase RimI-like enzyme